MLNKTILMGRLTRDPELRYTQSNIPVVSFTLAVDRGLRNATEGQQTVDYINCVAWRGTAEFVSRWFRKGQLVAVSGKIQSRNYTDKDGNNRTAVEIVADEVFFAESKKDTKQEFTQSETTAEVETIPENSYAEFEEIIGDDEDMPF